MAYADQQMSGNRIIAIIIVALIHIAIGYALITGLAYSAVKKAIERVTAVDIEEPEPEPEEEPPPPEPDTAPPPPVAPPPPINIAVSPPPIQVQSVIPPPAPVARIVPPPAPPAPPPAPPPPSQARGVSTRNEASWARRIQENYPSRAQREGTEGTVGVRVTVTPDGRATGCSVTSSSGSDVLDQAACDGMERYARFNPALNAAGDPISGSYSTRVTYRLN
jgi:protein TonB